MKIDVQIFARLLRDHALAALLGPVLLQRLLGPVLLQKSARSVCAEIAPERELESLVTTSVRRAAQPDYLNMDQA